MPVAKEDPQTGGNEEGHRVDPIEDPWTISKSQESTYAKMFEKLATEGFLSGKKAVVLLGKSGLEQDTLAKIWALADSDVDGRLSMKEFCMAMHLIGRVRKGLPLPGPQIKAAKKKSKKNKKGAPPAASKPNEAESRRKVEPAVAKSPKRRSRLTSLIECQEPRGDSRGTFIPTPHEPDHEKVLDVEAQDSPETASSLDHEEKLVEGTVPQHVPPTVVEPAVELTRLSESNVAHGQMERPNDEETLKRPNGEETLQPTQHPHFNEGAMRAVDEFSDCSRNKTIERRDRATPHPKRQPKLRQLDDKDVDAVFAEGPGAINSLRDVQSWRILVMGLQRLSGKDMARRIPVKVKPQRRHTLPIATKGELGRKQEFLPGRGRRTSLLGTAYEPAAFFLKQRAEKRSAREAELEKDTAKAAEKWKLKPLLEKAERREGVTADGEQADGSRGNLCVAGLPLLDEDIDIIVHLLKQNHAFNKLDLSRCFLSEKHLVSLAQALAWNSRVEELCLQECVFTDAGTAALADVLTVNNHIHSIDVRACKGLDEKGIQLILRAARRKANLLTFNGMELAALRAEGSTELDLSGWSLGYVEAVVVADSLKRRSDGLEKVDLHNNLLSTEAFTTLMTALLKQSQLRLLDLSRNMIDERTLPQVAELLRRNPRLAHVNLTSNRISCTEFEHYGLGLMRLLSSNNTVTVFNVDENNVSPKMLTIIAEKLAANRAVRRDMTFVDCLHLKYPRIAPRPVLADPRRLHLENIDGPFMAQEGIPAMRTTVRTVQAPVLTVDGIKPGSPLDFYFVEKCSVDQQYT